MSALARDVGALREIMSGINASRLEPPLVVQVGVREEEGAYLALPTYAPEGRTISIVREHPTYQWRDREAGVAHRTFQGRG